MFVPRCDGCGRNCSEEEHTKSWMMYSEVMKRLPSTDLRSPTEVFCSTCQMLAADYWTEALPRFEQNHLKEAQKRLINFRKTFFKPKKVKVEVVNESQEAIRPS